MLLFSLCIQILTLSFFLFASKTLQNQLSSLQRRVEKAKPRQLLFDENCRKYALTLREVEICRQVEEGLPYKLIADRLHISQKTVGRHLSNIFDKTQVSNKMELIRLLNKE